MIRCPQGESFLLAGPHHSSRGWLAGRGVLRLRCTPLRMTELFEERALSLTTGNRQPATGNPPRLRRRISGIHTGQGGHGDLTVPLRRLVCRVLPLNLWIAPGLPRRSQVPRDDFHRHLRFRAAGRRARRLQPSRGDGSTPFRRARRRCAHARLRRLARHRLAGRRGGTPHGRTPALHPAARHQGGTGPRPRSRRQPSTDRRHPAGADQPGRRGVAAAVPRRVGLPGLAPGHASGGLPLPARLPSPATPHRGPPPARRTRRPHRRPGRGDDAPRRSCRQSLWPPNSPRPPPPPRRPPGAPPT